jgi:hypothetical protein
MMENTVKKVSRKRRFLFALLFLASLICCASLFVPLSPTKSIIRSVGFILTGRLHFPTDQIGKEVTDEDGNKFTVFRAVVVDPSSDQPKQPGAVLILHFRVVNMTPDQNKIYSLFPLPLYIGDQGFRTKLFTISGEYCQSIYEWDTVQDAQNYLASMALKTVKMRSVPGSFSYKIIEK